MRKPGFNVEGQNFGVRYAQALARAKHLAAFFGRNVDVVSVDFAGCEETVTTCVPPRKVQPVRPVDYVTHFQSGMREVHE